MNQEAYGSVTESFFKMKLYSKEVGDFIHVHPTFLYESILDFFIFMVLMFLRKRKKSEGQLVYLYIILYGIGRALIEGLRTDSLMLGNIRISQLVSVVLVIFAVIKYFFAEKCRPKDTKKS